MNSYQRAKHIHCIRIGMHDKPTKRNENIYISTFRVWAYNEQQQKKYERKRDESSETDSKKHCGIIKQRCSTDYERHTRFISLYLRGVVALAWALRLERAQRATKLLSKCRIKSNCRHKSPKKNKIIMKNSVYFNPMENSFILIKVTSYEKRLMVTQSWTSSLENYAISHFEKKKRMKKKNLNWIWTRSFMSHDIVTFDFLWFEMVIVAATLCKGY